VPPGAQIDLTLRRKTNYIAGRISDQAGASVGDARVLARSQTLGIYLGSEYSDSNGNYELRVAPGTWTVYVYPPSTCSYLTPPAFDVTAPPDRPGTNVVLTAGTPAPTPTATVAPALDERAYLPLIIKKRQ